jgi:hypothetical protein
VHVADLPASIVLDRRTVAASAPSQPLLVLARPPAATYEIEATLSGAGAARITATVDREFGPQWSWDLPAEPGVWRHSLTLPLDVPVLAVNVGDDARRAVDSISIRALTVVTAPDRLTGDAPIHSTRLGPAVLFLRGGHAYTERGGTWIGGGDFGEFVIAPDTGAPMRVFVRNAPVRNQVTLESGEWRRTLTLEPREERMFDIPDRPDARGASLRVTTTAGVRPSDVDPASTDTRLLGCWIETR